MTPASFQASTANGTSARRLSIRVADGLAGAPPDQRPIGTAVDLDGTGDSRSNGATGPPEVGGTGVEAEDRRGPGRPRDPELEERVFDAVLGVYGRKGWSGLTIGEVAAQARVGKSSIYLRWPDKRSLLVAALSRHQVTMDEIAPRDSPRDFLVAHALRRADSYLGQYGLAFIRLHVEARSYPDESENIRRQALTDPALLQRQRLQSALNLTGPNAQTAVIQILDTLEGAVLMHILASPPELEARVRAKLPTYAVDLVDMLLRHWCET